MKKIMAVLLAAACLLSGCSLVRPAGTTAPALASPMDADSVFRTMFKVEDRISIELHFADGTSYGPYFSYSLPQELKLEADTLTEIAAPDLSGCTEWLTIGAADGSVRLSAYRSTPDILCYQEGSAVRYYQAPGNTEYNLRKAFDRVQLESHGRVSFYSGKSGRAILQTYAETAFPSFLHEMAPGSMYHIGDYQFRSVSLKGKTGKVIFGDITYAIRQDREEPQNAPIFGTFKQISDGWQVYEKHLYMEHQADGKWHEITQADYNAVYTEEYPPFDPTQTEPNPAALAFLEQLPEELNTLQKAADEASLIELAETFLQTTTAVPLSGSTEFDWKQFFTEGALQNTGVRALLKTFVNREGAKGYFKGYLSGKLAVDTVVLKDDTAQTANGRIRIWFTKTGGKWLISDVSMSSENW